ncbi:hypothetical protein P0136_10645 [Lentisphaerota bacterium ZTH]|nr:hypothetical protein JYG24_11840 [Lentisphaerota bacterium]WET05819.1 hypothetical protein P0136_10645 [Lentisphaerota bacterium ZTH]
MFDKSNKTILRTLGEPVSSDAGRFRALVDFAEISGKLGGFKKDYSKMELVMLETDAAKLKIGSPVIVRQKTYRIADKLNDGGSMVKMPLTDPSTASAPSNTNWAEF